MRAHTMPPGVRFPWQHGESCSCSHRNTVRMRSSSSDIHRSQTTPLATPPTSRVQPERKQGGLELYRETIQRCILLTDCTTDSVY